MTLAAQILGALCLVLGVFFWNGSASAVQEAASALVLILGVLLIGLAAIVAAIHRLREAIEVRIPISEQAKAQMAEVEDARAAAAANAAKDSSAVPDAIDRIRPGTGPIRGRRI